MSKLIAIDMDGTLLDDNKILSEKNIEALEKAHNQGFEIVVATGRSYTAAMPFIKQIKQGIVEYLICSNGAIIYNLNKKEIVFNDILSKEQIVELLELNDYLGDTYIHFVNEDTIHAHQNPIGKYVIMDGYLSFLPIKLDSREELSSVKNLNKALITVDEDFIDSTLARIPQEYFKKYNIVKSSENYIEVINQGVDKGHALEKLINKLNIDKSNIVAIGDQQNDLGMFELAGLSYAMSGASDFIKSKATKIGPSNNDSGIAKILGEILS